MTNLFKRFFTHKSKFLLIILCLLGMVFSYSCSCRADKVTGGGGPEGETDDVAGTFKASVNADGFLDTLRVNSQNKVHGNSALSILFTGKNGANKVPFEVHITDILDESADSPLDFSDDKDNGYSKYITYNTDTGALTFTGEGLKKIGGLVSTTEPQDRKVKITFKLDSDGSLGLKNSSTNFTKEFHLIKIKKIEESEIENILHKISDSAKHPFSNNDVINPKTANLQLNSGTYNIGVYTIENKGDSLDSFTGENVNNIITVANYYIPKLDEIEAISELSKDGGEGKKYYSVKFGITWGDNFESEIKDITFKYTL